MKPPREFFVGRFREVPNGCWRWLGYIQPSGYGRGSYQGIAFYAHRAVYEAFVAPIPDGHQLDHLCRNRWCVNPSHLEPVLPRENVLRGVGFCARRARQRSCVNGHRFDPANTYRRPDTGTRQCRACHRKREQVRRERFVYV